MSTIEVERLGGLAGFGTPGSHLVSRGQITLADLSSADREVVEALFADHAQRKRRAAQMPDSFRYRISRKRDGRTQTIEVAEAEVPAVLVSCVRDELI